MKEVEKNEIKRLSDRLDAIRHQQAELSLVEAADKYAELEKEKATLETEIERLRSVQSQKLSKEAQKLMSLPFRRAIKPSPYGEGYSVFTPPHFYLQPGRLVQPIISSTPWQFTNPSKPITNTLLKSNI